MKNMGPLMQNAQSMLKSLEGGPLSGIVGGFLNGKQKEEEI